MLEILFFFSCHELELEFLGFLIFLFMIVFFCASFVCLDLDVAFKEHVCCLICFLHFSVATSGTLFCFAIRICVSDISGLLKQSMSIFFMWSLSMVVVIILFTFTIYMR